MKDKALWLFTRQFPQGKGEAFLESALPVWAECFGEVRVIPMFPGDGAVALPAGVREQRLWTDAFATAAPGRSLAALPELLSVMRQRTEGVPFRAAELPEALSHARQLLRRADLVERTLLPDHDPQRVVLLSTWMEDWVSVLGLLRGRHPQLHFNTMAHGWDLYEHRRPDGRIPYRAAQMRQVDRVLCISDPGAAHLAHRFPALAHKVHIAHLGTQDHGAGPWSPGDALRVVSCAYLRSPKRIDRLARALALIDRPVHWTHFGDGPDMPALRAVVATLPPHVQVDLPGSVTNAEVLEHYRSRPVDLFALLSDDEGVPVSLMEAASFGIPLLANDVGGVRAVVTPVSGVLLPADADERSIATGALDAARRSADPAGRAAVRAFWREQFEAGHNYRSIATLLCTH